MKISVAICTYNRADSLADTLEHLCRQELGRETDWELLVIDNNCTDHTVRVTEDFQSRLPLRYFTEKRQGLSHGRNCAIQNCEGDLLIFTDDDVRPVPRWLTSFMGAARDYCEQADYFGGKIIPYWPGGKPRWVRDIDMPLLGGVFGTYDQGDETHLYGSNEMHPFGANFALRRGLFEELDQFRGDLGVSGDVSGRGEEAEYFKRARERGSIGVYVADAVTHHRVDADHLTLSYLYQFGVQKGIASRKIHGSSTNGRIANQLKYVVKGFYQLVKGRGDRFRQCIINFGIQQGLRCVD